MSSCSQTLCCVDVSGSTGNSEIYWSTVASVAAANQKSSFILWDTTAKVVSYEEVLARIGTRSGGGGTAPQCFAEMLPTQSQVIIITDGQVAAADVQKCDQLLNGREFASVDVHFVNTGGSMNLSVSAPFTRKTVFKLYVDGQLLSGGSSEKELELKEFYDNPEKFISCSEDLLRQIVMQNLGKNNAVLRNDLLGLQKNLLKHISLLNSSVQGDAFSQLREALITDKYDSAVELIKSAIMKADSSLGKRIESIIQEFVRQCSGSFDFSFDVLQPGRLSRAAPVAQIEAENITVVEDYVGSFECPVFLDVDTPVCLIKKGIPVFEGIEKGYLDALISNPFLLLLDADLVNKVKSRLDQLVGLSAIKELFAREDVVKSPLTRDVISCAMSFGADDSHLKATNFALADILFGKKLVGQSELWLAVIYFIVEEVSYLSSNLDFMEAFKIHMFHRMHTKVTNMTLSGLPIDPLMKCPVDIAIWYCVVSPHIIVNDTAVDDARNRLRSFGISAKYLVKLVKMFGYSFYETWTLHRLSIYKAFAWMMNEEKNHKSTSQWRKLIRSQYQNSLVLEDGTIILIDGAPTAKPTIPNFKATENAPDVSLSELIQLSELVDQNKTINSVMIPKHFASSDIPLPVKNYGYPENICRDTWMTATQICPETLRPYTIDKRSHRSWNLCAEEIFCPLSTQLSAYNYFIRFVLEMNEFPKTKEEFIVFLAAKQENRDVQCRMDTLPMQILVIVDALFSAYERILGVGFSNFSASEFKSIAWTSMHKTKRAILDGSSVQKNI